MNLRLSVFFFLQRLIGSRAGRHYRRFLEMETWPREKLDAWRDQTLRALLDHAAEHVPFYRNAGIRRDTPLSSFPVITKEMLHRHYLEMMTPDFRRDYESGHRKRGYGWLEVTSGGTTGIPTTVIHDADFRDMDRAARLYNQHLAGFPFGTPHYRLWGAVQDIRRTKKSFQQRLMAALAGERLLNAFRMEENQIDAYLDLFERDRRPCLIAYVDALEQLVKHALNRGRKPPAFTSVITTGGTLTDETAAFLRETLGANIHNQYGSRDCGALGCSCREGLIHIHAPNIHIEVVDDDGRPVPEGASGRVLVTFLGNRVFPIIRFEIGDVAVAGPAACSCGRPSPTLSAVTCRTSDIIRSTAGGYISPVFIRHMIGVEHGRRLFRRFQFIQHDRSRYELIIQPEEPAEAGSLEPVLNALRADLLQVLGEDAELGIRLAGHIEEAESGKFRYVVNRYRPGS